MTATSLPLGRTPTVRDQTASPGSGAGSVIVLTYPHAGGERLSSLLSRHRDLACTAGTGILPSCEQAAAAWRSIDSRPAGPPSQLAETSTRALAASMTMALLARHGKRRWCEVATAAPDAAATFARLFPNTRIVCLHRACQDVARAALRTSPWGLAGPAYAAFTSAHPVSTAAALTAYWTAHTASLLAFEEDHPGICQRIRYEDLATDSLTHLLDFLGLEDLGSRPTTWLYNDSADPAHGAIGPDAAEPDADFPAWQLPPALLERANSLMERLDYRPIGPPTAPAGSK